MNLNRSLFLTRGHMRSLLQVTELQLEYLHKNFALELVESVLTNYYTNSSTRSLSRSRHSELLFLLQHHLFPLFLKRLSDRSTFLVALRGTQTVFHLFKQFPSKLEREAAVIFTVLNQ
ncbi:hypothetical protein BGY98DRAFT_226749 [Russula aff. rugulosa BPL654]|nr:hypothetical protein BGY98DRAFT_226749 [Russula aff. rugulosa BPL654]